MHIIVIIYCDIISYKMEVLPLAADMFFAYLDYLNYLRVDKFFIMLECLGMLLCSVIAISHVQRMLEQGVESRTWIAFFLHFLIFNPLASLLTLNQLKKHTME